MAQHWSAYAAVTAKQAYALDKIADRHGKQSGRELLCDLAGCSSSMLSKIDAVTMRHFIDEAFALPGPDDEVSSAYVTADGDRRIVTIDGHDYSFSAQKWAAFRAAAENA